MDWTSPSKSLFLSAKLSMILLAAGIAFTPVAHAGYFEISATGNYRTSTVDEFNYSVSQSGTGALAYYFWEMSALEFSYTKGISKTFGKTSSALKYVTTVNFTSTGADFILSLAGKEAPFRPYLKVGVIEANVEQIYEQEGAVPVSLTVKGTGPSAGAGFRLLFSQNFALKTGVDAWKPPTQNQYDVAGNVGLSILF